MDQGGAKLQDDLGKVRTFARLICVDDESAAALLERALKEAIQLAEQGMVIDVAVRMLALMCSDPSLQAPKIVAFEPAARHGHDALVAGIRALPLPQRRALVLLDVLRLSPHDAMRVLNLDRRLLESRRDAARVMLRKMLGR
ncbi:hypothetical protein [Paracoccus litorisediminis]|uniref:RNA polymerase sigma factor 70 region 4 type 2 domain-containing protein n=1 Tax=Paracoccus litorisediminis TaxID=2006130 RepID=A0A844HRF5_9RHOB|nr:hypothetical protein [Paracoccus litorisediminis]MTH62440.1 hypothetical protein [Paracoccus litorisediminis]